MDAAGKVFAAAIQKHWDLFCEILYKSILVYANMLLKEQVFQLFALQTEFFIVNSRVLTYISSTQKFGIRYLNEKKFFIEELYCCYCFDDIGSLIFKST